VQTTVSPYPQAPAAVPALLPATATAAPRPSIVDLPDFSGLQWEVSNHLLFVKL
jgi:hypothetical protein